MKKIFHFLLAMIIIAHSASAQLDIFAKSQIFDIDYPANDIPFRADNTSAYSHNNLHVGAGNMSPLYVFTWDHFRTQSGSNYPAGIAIRQTSPFFQMINPVGFPVNDASSIEAKFLSRNDSTFVISTYYWDSQEGFYLDLYHYENNNLVQMPGFPINITANGAPVPLGWIHLDVVDLNNFVIVWEEYGKIFAKAGEASSNTLGNTIVLDNGIYNMPETFQPDVALIYSDQLNEINTHFVYTNPDSDHLIVSSLSYLDILNAPLPLNVFIPHLEDQQQEINWRFNKPRIDAPDHYIYDDWSYVVEKAHVNETVQQIFAGVKNHTNVVNLNHYVLNDGSMGGLADISNVNVSGVPYTNTQPTLAYSADNEHIYYVWNYFSYNFPMPGADSEMAYIGVKIDHNGNVIPAFSNPCFGIDCYWEVQYENGHSFMALSIALSGQNTASNGLFAAFVQYDVAGSGVYSMGSKEIPWPLQSFSDWSNVENNSSYFRVHPNPFEQHFSIQHSEYRDEIIEVWMYDVLGKLKFHQEGTLSQVNAFLKSQDFTHWPSGMYLLKLYQIAEGVTEDIKLIKY